MSDPRVDPYPDRLMYVEAEGPTPDTWAGPGDPGSPPEIWLDDTDRDIIPEGEYVDENLMVAGFYRPFLIPELGGEMIELFSVGEIARRLVAAYNACKGIPTDVLEKLVDPEPFPSGLLPLGRLARMAFDPEERMAWEGKK